MDIWRWTETGPALTPESKRHVVTPCAFKEADLIGDDGQECRVAIFHCQRPAVAFVPTKAPTWAEAAIAKAWDENGKARQ